MAPPQVVDSESEDVNEIESELSDVLSIGEEFDEADGVVAGAGDVKDEEDDEEDEEEEEIEEEDDDEDDEEDDDEELPVSDEEAYKLEDPDEIEDDLELRDEEEEVLRSSKPAKTTKSVSSSRADVSSNKIAHIHADSANNRRTNAGASTKNSAPRAAGVSSSKASTDAGLSRSSRKRTISYYEGNVDDLDEDDEDEDEEDEAETPRPTTRQPSSTGRRSRPAVPSYQVEDLDEDLILTDEETEYNPHAHPDPTKMTERQRARFNDQYEESVSADELPERKTGKEKTKQTEHEEALRRAETNRKRLDYKNKQLDEEKRDTLNKLLKRRTPKTREVQKGDEEEENGNLLAKPRRPEFRHKALFRWVSTASGSALGTPV